MKTRSMKTFALAVGLAWSLLVPAQAQDAQKPSILVIVGDDAGWFHLSAVKALIRKSHASE